MEYKHPNVFSDIIDFHEAMCEDQMNAMPTIVSPAIMSLRVKLIMEEVRETLQALMNNDLEGIADGIADSVVVLLGTAVAYGIDFDAVWREVHRTNMAKRGGPVREDGKRLKPEGWVPPNIKKVLAEQNPIL